MNQNTLRATGREEVRAGASCAYPTATLRPVTVTQPDSPCPTDAVKRTPRTRQRTCVWCEEELAMEERKYPVYADGFMASKPTSGHGGVICDECFHDEYEFSCCKCGNHEHTDRQDEIGNLLVVTDPSVAVRGIYLITAHPYFCQPMIGHGSLFMGALRRIAPASAVRNIDTGGFPVGHLCGTCTAKITTQFAATGGAA